MGTRYIPVVLIAMILACGCTSKSSLPRAVGSSADVDPACAGNLKELGLACNAYAVEHWGQFPNKLQKLWPNYIRNPNYFVCPSSGTQMSGTDNIDAESSYVITKYLSNRDEGNIILIREKSDSSHNSAGHHALAIDGRITFERM